jgi:hypothetical protein
MGVNRGVIDNRRSPSFSQGGALNRS